MPDFIQNIQSACRIRIQRIVFPKCHGCIITLRARVACIRAIICNQHRAIRTQIHIPTTGGNPLLRISRIANRIKQITPNSIGAISSCECFTIGVFGVASYNTITNSQTHGHMSCAIIHATKRRKGLFISATKHARYSRNITPRQGNVSSTIRQQIGSVCRVLIPNIPLYKGSV